MYNVCIYVYMYTYIHPLSFLRELLMSIINIYRQHQIELIKTLFLRFGHCPSSECSNKKCYTEPLNIQN